MKSNFNKILKDGPESMKDHLAKLWNDISPDDINKDFELTDKDRVITKNDFDVTMNHVGDYPVFYFIMPDPDSVQAQAKCVALAITFYSLWTVSINNDLMVYTVPAVLVLLMRYSLDVEGASDGDPTEIILHDKFIIILGILYALFMFTIIYWL